MVAFRRNCWDNLPPRESQLREAMEAKYEGFTPLPGAKDMVREVVGREVGLCDSWRKRKGWI
jgi:hypothetical protein